MQQDFQNTLAAANNIQAPASPLGNFPELANFFKNSFQAPTRQAGLGAYATNNQIQVGNAERAAAAAMNAKKEELAQKINEQDPSNPDNYKQVPKEDGGYDFFDPAGNKITVQQYSKIQSKLTGKQITPAQVLADSQNSLDQQYLTDFTNLQKLMNLTLSGDTANRDKLATQLGGKELVNLFTKSKITPDQLIRQFMSYYPHIYDQPKSSALPSADQVRGGAGIIGYTPNNGG